MRDPTESPLRFARRIAPELEDAAPLVEFAERYEAARFGRKPPDAASLRKDAAAAKRVRARAKG